MTSTELQLERIDIGEHWARNPQSETLRMLAQAALSDRHEGYQAREGWWESLCDEYHAGTLSPVEAVAAYVSVMHPFIKEFPEKKAVEQTARLVEGEKIVTYTEPSSFGHGYRVNFDPSKSGVLQRDAIALLGHPSNRKDPYAYADVHLGLQFTHHDNVCDVYPAQTMAIGSAEIISLYRKGMGPRNHIWAESAFDLFSHRLGNAAIVKRLGLLQRDSAFKQERDKLVEDVGRSIRVARSKEDTVTVQALITLLPDVHMLNSNIAESEIRDLVTQSSDHAFNFHKDTLVDAVARIRAPKVLDTLDPLNQELIKAKALAEIIELRIG